MTKDEIFGIVTHSHNYPEVKVELEKFFKYLSSKDSLFSRVFSRAGKRKTVTWIMENYVLPNNLVIKGGCGDSLCDDTEKATGSCIKDCGRCVFPEDCVWCNSLDKCPECKRMRECEQGNDQIIHDFVFGK